MIRPAFLVLAFLMPAMLARGPAAHAQSAPAAPPRSAEQAVIAAQLAAKPGTPSPGLDGAEANAIYQRYIANIGKARSPFAGASTTSATGYGGAATPGQ
ncbi:MAG: hypothetical protein KGL12_02345 [Rhodospirillales bacterium]|nr:hypothetical protein [Rhodospirillales bacterium]